MVAQSSAWKPEDAFSAAEYPVSWFWIAERDFDSKLAFPVVSLLLALAKTTSMPNPIITISTK